MYFNLLKEWCDSLLTLQVNEIKSPGIYGGIMCPACSRIHGRCADAVYPLMHMAHATGEKRYIEAAVKLQAWSEHVSSPDGSWVNEIDNPWKGITVFGALSLGEALRHHGILLDKEVHDRWSKRLESAAIFIYNTFTIDTGNINYPITASAALTVAGKVLNNSDFIRRGKEFAHEALHYFTENKLLFGEGHPQDGFSPNGCRAVDIGYNVEESLPALVIYGLLTGDEEVLDVVKVSLGEHLEFMLPDGAWDNSWGSRDFKWTYWGSRTSDGCQTAYSLLADHDPRFAEAARRNTLLLKACTHDGILYGGPHYHIKGELPCIHHTFCHAKALATVLDFDNPKSFVEQGTTLPREKAVGVKEYPEIRTWLVSLGSWRATITAYDWEYMKAGHPSGGSISLLWHEEIGLVLTGSLTEYSMHESSNMQRVKDRVDMSLTPRMELLQEGVYYRSCNDYNASVNYSCLENEIRFAVSGSLVDKDQGSPNTGEVKFCMDYIFKSDHLEISIDATFNLGSDKVLFYIPVCSNRTEKVNLYSNSAEILKKQGKLTIASNSTLNQLDCDNDRIFNHVPGVEAYPLFVEVETDKNTKINISYTTL